LAPENAGRFHDAVAAAKAAHPDGPAVTLYPPEQYARMRTFLTDGDKAGFALNGDDIVSVFRSPESSLKRATLPIMDLATALGGKRLDAFDTVLPELYSESGFRAVARPSFDPKFAPPGWNYQRLAPFNCGKPDIIFMLHDVFMVHDPAHAMPYAPGDGITAPTYEAARAIQRHVAGGGDFIPVDHDPFQ
jgi:hypothetical protein